MLTQRRQVGLIAEAIGEPVRVEPITEDRAREEFGAFAATAGAMAALAGLIFVWRSPSTTRRVLLIEIRR